MSILEVVRSRAHEGRGAELAARLETAVPLLLDDPECLGVRVLHGIEEPDTVIAIIEWTSIEAHLRWRESEAAPAYRARIADLLGAPNEFGHYNVVLDSPRPA
jgi:heme-degrading monooxygenase HmoA